MHKFLTAKWMRFLQLFLCCSLLSSAFAQNENPCDTSSRYLYWTGEVNSDFFNEKNWRITVEQPLSPTVGNGGPVQPACLPGLNSYLYSICPNQRNPANDRYPRAGTLEPGLPIRYNLLIETASVDATGAIVFACSQKGMTLINSQLNVVQGTITQGVLSLINESTVHLREGDFSQQLSLNFLDAASWVYMHQENPDEVMSKLPNILIDHVAGVLDNNFRINQYYQRGTIIRPLAASWSPLRIFSKANQQGNSSNLFEDLIYSGPSIPGGMDKFTHSFILKRGYMATFAVNTNGTGKSKVYIASEEDLEIDALEIALQGNVRFMRVVPWNWVTKKGTGFYYDLDAGWFYNWNFTGSARPNTDYVPMAWGASGALPPALHQIKQKKNTTHVLGFNESDNCDDQSGQFNNLCQPAVAVAYFENLMGLGLRLGSPAPREQGPSSWLLEFNRIAKEKNVRFDFVAVHWYDWGSNPASSPNADPQQIFNRFKNYLQNVYTIYHLPIWITEFNANPNRGNAIQEAFLNLALPYLEGLDYVERYAFFQPNSSIAQNPTTSANYFDANGAITNIGSLYKSFQSTASIPDLTYICPNNLEGLDIPYVPLPVNTLAFEAECANYPGNQWEVLSNTDASNGQYIRGNNNLPGLTALSKQVHFEFELAEAGSYRVYIRSSSTGGNGSVRIKMNGNDLEQITPLNSTTFSWLQIPRFYDLGIGKHRLTIEYPNSNILLDQVAITNGPENLDLLKKDVDYCTPATFKWGLESTDIIRFYEAETASAGINWMVKTSVNARGGAYLSCEENITSPDVPESDTKVITFNITADHSDEYEIWAKIQAISNAESSLWISVDNEPFRKWSNLSNPTYEWYWKKFHYTYGTENRSFTYFLEAGQHQVKIAFASGNVSVDVLAVVTKGKNPEPLDPNVLLLDEQLEFEAEDAERFGNTTIQLCENSSNGEQVLLGNVNTNGVRFPEIVAEEAGPYKLKVSYMSKVSRFFRLKVNGTILGRQTVSPSGNWCFIDPVNNPTKGSPAIYELVVILKRGINNIEITPFSGEAPIIDKIKLEKAELNELGLEAETAELFSNNNTTVIANCTVASNGALVNMGTSTNNGIRYNNLVSSESKTYQVDVHYITKVQRNLKLSMNGQAFTTLTFAPSGNWCFETSPTVAVNSIELAFLQGANVIEFRPTGTDAPFIDKIVIREAIPVTGTSKTQEDLAEKLSNPVLEQSPANTLGIYPNPARAGTLVTLSLPFDASAPGPVFLQITDITGRVVSSQYLSQKGSGQVKLGQSLNKGLYIFTITQGSVRTSKKIVVQ